MKGRKLIPVMVLSFLVIAAVLVSLRNKGRSSIEVRHQYFNENVNGVRLYYHIVQTDPNKPYVFFLHGGPGHNSWQFEQIAPFLTKDKVNWIFMDQRGSGRSAVYHSDPSKSELSLEQLTPELMVEDIEGIRQKHNLGKIIIYGHSWGGNLASYYVYRYPASLLGYIISSCNHSWQDNTELLIDYYLRYIPEVTEILQNWLRNGYSRELAYHLSELKPLFEVTGALDVLESLLHRENLNGVVRARVVDLIHTMKEIKANLLDCQGKQFNAKMVFDICGLTGRLGSYGVTNTPALDLSHFPLPPPMKPNQVKEAWANGLPEDNVWYYPKFEVPGVFWCGQNDIWGPEVMVPAASLAPNSSYFIFPHSGHDYYLSEPYLFTRKLTETVDIFSGAKKDIIDKTFWPSWTGLYKNSILGECRVVIEGKDLVGYVAGSRVVCKPVSTNEFIMQGGPGNGGRLTFIKEPNGGCNSFIARGLKFKRVASERKSEKKE